MGNQLPRCNVEQPVRRRHDRPRRTSIQPRGLIGIIRQETNCAERFQQVADLVAVRRPCNLALVVHIDAVLGEGIQLAADFARFQFAPVRSAPSPPGAAPIVQRQLAILGVVLATNTRATAIGFDGDGN